ncbi:hypothetical protein QTG54_014339 [Skeletonema marinoi]|uniref:Secreted protein n=1 Tax=Skeletonema marinoi TaxID=267567 RepID=A0AAD9D6P1_9STRA|nr:hypothetical protein QTG54_014339 [Skeletonema marinoi]
MRQSKFMLVVCCCCSATTSVAFLPSGTSIVVRHHLPSSSYVFGTIGNEDFSKIFGSQEASERRTRDLAREYHPRPKTTDNDGGSGTEESNTGNKKHIQQQQQQQDSEQNKSVARKSKVVRKYVPPPGLWKK